MDDSYPVILTNKAQKDDRKKGSIKELTLLELQKETRRLFKDEFDKSDVTYAVEGQEDMELEEDDDIETEWEELNGESDDDDEDHDEDDAEDEESGKKPLRIVVTFTLRKIEIRPPAPVGVRTIKKSSTTVTFSWGIGPHKLDNTQISSLKFEIIQQIPKINQDKPIIIQCNPIADSSEKYVVKISGLTPNTRYQFVVRSVLFVADENENKYSDSSKPQDFNTTKIVSMNANQLPTTISPPTDLQVIALYPDKVILAWNHAIEDYNNNNYDYEYYIEESDYYGGEIVAATEDQHFLELHNLTPSTQYTFVCKAKYYDPQRKLSDQYYRNTQIISSPTNTVTITTPEEKSSIDDYKTRPIDKARWTKQGMELELFWSAPESFRGKIEYQLMDKIQNKILGPPINKLPVIISTGDGKSIFGTKSGKYTIQVSPILIDERQKQRVTGKPYDIQIS